VQEPAHRGGEFKFPFSGGREHFVHRLEEEGVEKADLAAGGRAGLRALPGRADDYLREAAKQKGEHRRYLGGVFLIFRWKRES